MRAMLLTAFLLLSACAAPSRQPTDANDGEGASAPRAAQPAGDATRTSPPTAMTPSPVTAGSTATVQVDDRCERDADCAVKDVGSCCGAMPACVNRNSPTDPAGVRAACSAQDRASVCGFNEITACHCVRGHCAAEQEPVGGWTIDPTPPKPENR